VGEDRLARARRIEERRRRVREFQVERDHAGARRVQRADPLRKLGVEGFEFIV
jgi:hypothetical protein